MAAVVEPVIIDRAGVDALIGLLAQQGYTVVAPVVRDDAIVYAEVDSADELPEGWTDRQEAGTYRLERRDDAALFGYNVGPASWKSFLHPERLRLWQANRGSDGIEITVDAGPPSRYAFIGVRSCELHAMGIQDTVFRSAVHQDDDYLQRRDSVLIVAVNCTQAGATCFCTSMSTGPKVTSAYDLCLTELVDTGEHRFMVEVGSDKGSDLCDAIVHRTATVEDCQQAEDAIAGAGAAMGRHLDTTGIKTLLQANPEHPRWEEVAERCLSCANCTMVCPTCFCTTVEDVTDVRPHHAERWRRWDSCFTQDFSYVHGGSVRQSGSARYRQWLTHKFANWIDQFDSSGCVGCGRCITWCPVGIDVTEEVAAIRNEGHHTVPETLDTEIGGHADGENS